MTTTSHPGKRTFLDELEALMQNMPLGERLITIEEPPEITLRNESDQQGSPWIYLTNAVGELTCQGSIVPDDAMLQRVPFERGPGHLRAYLVEIEGQPWVAGCLEVSFDHEHWSAGEPFAPEAEVRAYCGAVMQGLCTDGEIRVAPLDDHMVGRFEISAAVPLRVCRDVDDALARLSAVYGPYALLEGYPERAVATPALVPAP